MKKANALLLTVLALALIAAPMAYAREGSDDSVLKAGFGIGLGTSGRDHPEDNDKNNGDDRKGDLRDTVKAKIGSTVKERALAEIDRRVTSLGTLKTRVAAMKRVSDASKASINAMIDTQISLLTTLKAKIVADTDEATLKADIESITKSYRIYMLILPQGAILATADRISTTADLMTDFGTKLETRITDAKNAGHDVSTLTTTYADYKAKIADAKVQAAAALDLTANLKPDNGDQAIKDANSKAIASARAKIKIAHDDLKAARKDAQSIVKALKEFNITVEDKIKADR